MGWGEWEGSEGILGKKLGEGGINNNKEGGKNKSPKCAMSC